MARRTHPRRHDRRPGTSNPAERPSWPRRHPPRRARRAGRAAGLKRAWCGFLIGTEPRYDLGGRSGSDHTPPFAAAHDGQIAELDVKIAADSLQTRKETVRPKERRMQ